MSGILLFLAFPTYDFGWTAWVGLVPLLVAISGRRPAGAFFLSFVCGIVFFGGVFSWGFDIPGYKFLHHVLLGTYLGPFLGLFGMVFSFIYWRLGVTVSCAAAPFVWVCLEYIRSNLFFLSFPWPILAHSQYSYLPIIQFSSFTGAYGVSFLIVLVNSALALAVLALLSRRKGYASPALVPPSKKGLRFVMLSTTVLLALALAYGWATLPGENTGKKIRVSVVQGNIDQKIKANPRKHAAFIMQRYIGLTEKANLDRRDLVVWPEAATPGLVLKSMTLLRQMTSLIRESHSHFLVGSAEYSKFSKDPAARKRTGNTALFFSPKGKVLGQYLKIRLLPFGEYVPHPEIIPWPNFIVPKDRKNWDMPGNEVVLFELNGSRFGTVICWENAFAGLFRRFVKKGADFMINITNEGWFGETAAPYQFLALCVFRAVENRVPLVRAANNGVSCFIDSSGRITGRVLKDGKDIFVDGYLTREITPSKERTFYTVYGDVFVYLSFVLVVLIVAYSVLRYFSHF